MARRPPAASTTRAPAPARLEASCIGSADATAWWPAPESDSATASQTISFSQQTRIFTALRPYRIVRGRGRIAAPRGVC